jgi:hypothetical protein
MSRGECRFFVLTNDGLMMTEEGGRVQVADNDKHNLLPQNLAKYLPSSFNEPLSSGVNKQFSKFLNNGKINPEQTKSSFDVAPA